MSSLITNIVLSDRPLYHMYFQISNYLSETLSPIKIKWRTIEGFWPGFQLRQQQSINDQQSIVPDNVSLFFKPQTVEIEERTNWLWKTHPCIPFTTVLGKPFFDTEALKVYLRFLRIKGTFEVELHSHSPVLSHDFLITTLARFNNRFVYLENTNHYPIVIPIRLIADEKPEWYDLLISSNQVSYSYWGVTGEKHFGFHLPLKPLLKLSSPPSYSIVGEQLYSVICNFEYMVSIPTTMLWEDLLSPINYINYKLTYDSMFDKAIASILGVNNELIGFVPIGGVKLEVLETEFNIITTINDLVWCVVDITNSYNFINAEVVVEEVIGEVNKKKIKLNLPTNTNLTHNVYFFWGRRF